MKQINIPEKNETECANQVGKATKELNEEAFPYTGTPFGPLKGAAAPLKG